MESRALLGAIIALNLGMVYIQVLVNEWIREFYNVLQSLDKARFAAEILRFCLLAGAYIAQAVYMLYLSQMLQIRWRNWLTDKYLRDWLTHQAYYRINFAAPVTDNPDQRISEDINSYIEMPINLGTNLLEFGGNPCILSWHPLDIVGYTRCSLRRSGRQTPGIHGLGRAILFHSRHLAHHAYRESSCSAQFQSAKV